MPSRILREGILSSERVDKLEWKEEVFYRRLMSIVDDFGRFEANEQLLKARCYPLRLDSVRTADITRWMAACQKAGLLVGYTANGKRYLQLLDFNQTRRTASKFPEPPTDVTLNICEANATQMKTNVLLGVVVGEGVSEVVIGGEGQSPPPFDEFEKAWNDLGPPFGKIAKATEARKAAFKTRYRDKFFQENWREALNRMTLSSFCKGAKGWTATPDWFLRPDTCTKLIEGTYSDSPCVRQDAAFGQHRRRDASSFADVGPDGEVPT